MSSDIPQLVAIGRGTKAFRNGWRKISERRRTKDLRLGNGSWRNAGRREHLLPNLLLLLRREIGVNGGNLEGGELERTVSFSSNAGGELLSAEDPDSSYAYAYDGLGRVTQVDNDGTPGAPRVVLDMTYDANGNRTGLSATIGATADFANSYVYDGLGRMTRVEQLGQTGGNGVAAKRVDLSYNALGQFTEIVRQTKPSSPWNEVATSTYGYDALHRLTWLDHTHGATDINNDTWTFDNLSGAVPGLSELSGGGNSIVRALSVGVLFGGLERITQMTSADGTSNHSLATIIDLGLFNSTSPKKQKNPFSMSDKQRQTPRGGSQFDDRCHAHP